MRQWHGLVRLRHRVILAMTEQMLRDRRAFHTLYSPLSSTCRRHRASWKDCWSKLAAAVSQLTNLHMLNPQCDWLAFNLDQDQREVYSKHWDFAPAFLIKPEIDRGSIHSLAGDRLAEAHQGLPVRRQGEGGRPHQGPARSRSL